MKKSPNQQKKLTGGALVLAAAASVFAQQQPFMQAGTAQPPLLPAMPKAAAEAGSGTNTTAVSASNPIANFCGGKIPDALANGKFNLNVRVRYEQVNGKHPARCIG